MVAVMAGPTPLNQQNFMVPNSSPIGTAINNLTTASQQIIGANPMRRGISFSNPGSVNIYVCPANLTADNANLGGMFPIYPGGEKQIFAEGNLACNCAWNAIAASGSNQPLTVLEFV